jgi:hypothetical protein
VPVDSSVVPSHPVLSALCFRTVSQVPPYRHIIRNGNLQIAGRPSPPSISSGLLPPSFELGLTQMLSGRIMRA